MTNKPDLSKFITGQKVIEALNCSPEDVVILMHRGRLVALHNGRRRVYDTDDPDNHGPGAEVHLAARRGYAIHQARCARTGETNTAPIHPPGWYGISYSADESGDQVKELYFRPKDIEALKPHEKPKQRPKERPRAMARRLVKGLLKQDPKTFDDMKNVKQAHQYINPAFKYTTTQHMRFFYA